MSVYSILRQNKTIIIIDIDNESVGYKLFGWVFNINIYIFSVFTEKPYSKSNGT